MKKSKTKSMLLLEAYKLFASEPYDQVTFTDLERVTKLSRGAIIYHIKNKESLFSEVIKDYVFERNSTQFLFDSNPKIGLKNFISLFLEFCRNEKKKMKLMGIRNINFAMFNVECAAFYFYPDMKQKAKEWVDNETEVWKQVLNNAIANGEIKPDIDVITMASLLENIYLGTSYHGMVLSRGYDLRLMEKEFVCIYNSIKL